MRDGAVSGGGAEIGEGGEGALEIFENFFGGGFGEGAADEELLGGFGAEGGGGDAAVGEAGVGDDAVRVGGDADGGGDGGDIHLAALGYFVVAALAGEVFGEMDRGEDLIGL